MTLEKLAGCLILRKGPTGVEEVLLVEEKKDRYWKIPSGKIEGDETSEQYAIRETKEEAGVDVILTSLFGSYSFNFKKRNFLLDVYEAQIVGGTPRANEQCPEEVNFLPIEVLNFQNTTPSNNLIYRDLIWGK